MTDIENVQHQANNYGAEKRESHGLGGINLKGRVRVSKSTKDLKPLQTRKKRIYNSNIPFQTTAGKESGSRKASIPGRKDRSSRNERKGPVSPDKLVIKDKKASQSYLKGKLLGRGGFAKVYEFTHVGSDHKCAGKCVNKKSIENNARARAKLHSEIKIHRSLNHRLVVRFDHYFEDPEYVFILLEMCTQRTLLELVKRKQRLKESHAKWFTLQIVDAVSYLHSENVIHRDLKLGNIFLTNNMEIRIGDFGLATKLDYPEQRRKTVCGTPNYIAPEIISGRSGHSFEVDIWSMGIILYTMVIGKPPFETRNVKTTYKRIQANDYSFPSSAQISSAAKDLIMRILTRNPKRRPSLDEIRHHSFCADIKRQLVSAADRQANHSTTKQPAETCSKERTKYWQKPQKSKDDKIIESIEAKMIDMTIGNKSDANSVAKRTSTEAPKKSSGDSATDPPPQRRSSRTGKVETKQTAEKPKFSKVRKSLPTARSKNCSTNVWVTKWVDYTSKYGLGYLLRGGVVGVYFNDSSKLVVAQDRNRFEYYERQATVKQSFTMDEYPNKLEKKVTLVKHFRSYLEKKKHQDMVNFEHSKWYQQDKIEREAEAELRREELSGQDLPYVKKWVRTRHAIFFRLSNSKVQVAFFDGTYILLSAMQRLVTYIDKEDNYLTLSVDEAQSNPKVETRLKYTKEVLDQLTSQGSKRNSRKNKVIAKIPIPEGEEENLDQKEEKI